MKRPERPHWTDGDHQEAHNRDWAYTQRLEAYCDHIEAQNIVYMDGLNAIREILGKTERKAMPPSVDPMQKQIDEDFPPT